MEEFYISIAINYQSGNVHVVKKKCKTPTHQSNSYERHDYHYVLNNVGTCKIGVRMTVSRTNDVQLRF